MQNYRFTMRNSRTGNEDLGDIALTDDNDACDFARRIIAELMKLYAAEYADAAIGIMQGKRIVASIPFDFDAAMPERKYG